MAQINVPAFVSLQVDTLVLDDTIYVAPGSIILGRAAPNADELLVPLANEFTDT